uniref:Uncharacterized protein n=1 Tax=Nothobranchius kadleci TaxID=1051664 RepID=A0A1A8DSI5_NOTKA
METVFPRKDTSHWGRPLEPGLELGHIGECLVAGLLPMELNRAQPEKETWVPLSMSSPHVGGAKGVGCIVCRVVAEGRDLSGLILGYESWLMVRGMSERAGVGV